MKQGGIQMNLFRIFLSSPGDCVAEREAVHEIAAHLNADPLVNSFIHIKVVAWDQGEGIPLELLSSPQASVNTHLLPPEQCEVFIGIFHCRLGTPLPTKEFRKLNGSPYLSGSEYEFHRAWEARRRGASRPAMLIYRRKDEPTPCSDAEQRQNLEAFFRQPPFQEDGQWIGSVDHYENRNDFSAKLKAHLRTLLSQHQPGASPPFEAWFKQQALLVMDNAGPRYTGNAHVETGIGSVFDWLLARQVSIADLDKTLAEVWKEIDREDVFNEICIDLARIAEALRNAPLWQTTPDFDFMRSTLERIRNQSRTEREAHEKADEKARKGEAWRDRKYRLRQIVEKTEKAEMLLERHAPLAQQRILLLTGPAGQGKTHTLVHEIERTVSAGGIALGVLGQTLNATGGLWEAICARVGWQGTHDQLLDKLENEAANRNQRALLVIDALNETPIRHRWRNELSGMVREVLRRPHLALAISVRSDYLEQTLPPMPENGESPWVEWEHPGFSEIEPDALLCYFEHYGVKAPVAPPLGEFANPLYVQLLAKSMKGRPLRHWLPSWLDVWRAWMDRLEEDARDKLGLDDASRPQAMHRTMKKIARAMLDDGVFSLPRAQADAIAQETTRVDRVIDFLCSAGALMDRVGVEDEEVIEFGFERLSDTFLADQLLSRLFKGLDSREARRAALIAAFGPDGMLYPLATAEQVDHPLRYRRSGLLEAMCLAVPSQIGLELPTLLPKQESDWPDWELDVAFNDSLHWRAKPEDFGADRKELFALWRKHARHDGLETDLDELIRFSLIPGHPFAMEQVIHPKLMGQENPGARDALWSIHLVPLWISEQSNLRQLVVWARDASLHGVQPDIALPTARLLAWMGASSQNALRQAAMQGLTRLLVACPLILDEFLPDFLEVNDPYVLEGVLLAVWGVVLDGADRNSASLAARRVYESQFLDGNARWCHVTLRHYARRIVERAYERGWLPEIDLAVVRPPYRSALPLDEVPTKVRLEALDRSNGFGRIVFSTIDHDFYRYIMGGNHPGTFDYSSLPLPASPEPARPFLQAENHISHHANPKIFDLALAARFVAWNCRQLGWTAEQFDGFDTGHFTRDYGHISGDGRTERIGKKYQWISWHTLLGFLADNYAMHTKYRDEGNRQYDTPDQVGVHLYDPSRWLQLMRPIARDEDKQTFWRIPSLPPWPLPDLKEMCKWVASDSHDLQPSDVIAHIPELPPDWGDGPWLRLAAEHTWHSHFAPGQWALGNGYRADIWWQCWPFLIRRSDFPAMLTALRKRRVREEMVGTGRVDPDEDWNTPLSDWPELLAEWDQGFVTNRNNRIFLELPIPWRPLVGSCGHPDRRDEHKPVLLPLPSLFQEWNLQLDLRRGLVLYRGEPLFGLAGWVHGQSALFARQQPLLELLAESGYTLVWWWRGERRACMDFGMMRHEDDDIAWADYCGIGYLAADGRVQTAWIQKKLLKKQ